MMNPVEELMKVWVSWGYRFPDDFVLEDFVEAHTYCDELIPSEETDSSHNLTNRRIF